MLNLIAESVPTINPTSAPVAPTESAWAIIQADPNLSLFEQAVITAGLQATLESSTVTIVAPTNHAITAMPASAAILADAGASEALVQAHVMSGELDSATIFGTSSLSTIGAQRLTVNADHTITGSSGTGSIVSADIRATNGYVHSIDVVLLAPSSPPSTTTTTTTTPTTTTAAPPTTATAPTTTTTTPPTTTTAPTT